MDVGMLFGILFAVILISMVLFFGSDQIFSFFNISNEAASKQQINDFNKEVSNVMSLAMGSVKDFTFKVLSYADKVCFLNPGDLSSNPAEDWDPNEYQKAFVTNGKYNILTMEKGNVLSGVSIENLIPQDNFCISSTTKLYLENEGRYVSVRPS